MGNPQNVIYFYRGSVEQSLGKVYDKYAYHFTFNLDFCSSVNESKYLVLVKSL